MNIKKVFNKNDEYYTPKYAIEPLLPFLKPFKKIWCPFDMEWSNYVKMLSKDHEVIYTHKDTGGDFFNIEVPECDAIVSNPPYIKTSDIDNLQPEVQKEPAMALDGGEDGLLFYREIIKNFSDSLKKGGRILFEIGNEQGNDVFNLLDTAGFADVSVIKDIYGNDRIVTAVKK